MKSVLEGILMKCPNNENGCGAVLRYSEIIHHLQKCGFKSRCVLIQFEDVGGATKRY
jgi:hypothetical protein